MLLCWNTSKAWSGCMSSITIAFIFLSILSSAAWVVPVMVLCLINQFIDSVPVRCASTHPLALYTKEESAGPHSYFQGAQTWFAGLFLLKSKTISLVWIYSESDGYVYTIHYFDLSRISSYRKWLDWLLANKKNCKVKVNKNTNNCGFIFVSYKPRCCHINMMINKRTQRPNQPCKSHYEHQLDMFK